MATSAASELAESILNQALILARKMDSNVNKNQIKNIHDHYSSSSSYPYVYPTDELEWLAIVAFNQAVDFFLQSAELDCKRWARKAIALADFAANHQESPAATDDGDSQTQTQTPHLLGQLLRANLERLGVSMNE